MPGINRPANFMFIRAEDRYEIKWAKNPRKIIIDDNPVPMPIVPDDQFIKGIDLKTKKQKYTPEIVPDDIHTWKPNDVKAYAKSQWHRRMNGEWQMINGEPYFIPGGAIPFFDFWTLESGKRPEFRYSALKLFWLFYNYVEPNPDIFGIYVLKTRRIGDTANFLYMLWEGITRYRGVRGGLQSYNDTIAAKTFGRLSKGNRNMPFFFRPNHSGSDKEYLAFMSPTEINTMKKLREADKVTATTKDEQFLSSFIDYQATVVGAYDGEQLFRILMDEVLKVPPYKMDAREQFANIRRCLSLFGEMKIYGKAFVSSTVEERQGKDDEFSTVDVGRWFWDNSDPRIMKESPDNRTMSGLIRTFRGYEDAALPDEFGFPQISKAKFFRDARLSKALKAGDMSTVADIQRKEPSDPDEALMEDPTNCPLFPEICQMRINQIQRGLDKHNNPIPDYRLPYVEGILEWKNNRPNTEVQFRPMKGGPWHISQFPVHPNNVRIQKILKRDDMGNMVETITWVGMNAPYYRLGSDPISSNPNIIGKGSEAAITVKRRWNEFGEVKTLDKNEHGIITNPEDMETNQIVADYLHRPYSPEESFRQMIMACWWYGAPILIEVDKADAYAYMYKYGYRGFVMYEPQSISALRKRKAQPGIRSAADVVALYTTNLQLYISNYWPAIKHPRVLKQAGRFIPKKRTKFDAVVSWGMAELADMENRFTDNEENQEAWAEDPFKRA